MSNIPTPGTFPMQVLTPGQETSIEIDPPNGNDTQDGAPNTSSGANQGESTQTLTPNRLDIPLPPGHPALAEYMSKIPEMAMFRRFGTLNLQNLLYLQAEILELEQTLQTLQKKDSQGNEEQRRYATNWWFLRNAKRRGGTGEQWSLVEIIRKKLYEYNEALMQQHSIMHMPKPTTRDTLEVQKLLEAWEMGPAALTGDDSHIWGCLTDNQSPPFHDLVALLPRHSGDPLSSWVISKAEMLTNMRFRSKGSNLQGYRDQIVAKWTNVFVNVLASLFPVASNVILYVVQPIGARFGVIAAFSVLLSGYLSAFTTAKQSEIFAVAAAWAAVQVVFASIGDNCDCG
ncbi:uncharacterized protein BKA78DRAFT_357666 [Phyllosticta capitalensis]|uniref:uncharacterized protein n=1 Tax=Phyllosticta capitalensis TaxID=121624 RepID=UPI0031318CC8